MLNDRDFDKVKRRVAAKREFVIHMFIWFGCSFFLFLLNMITSAHFPWFLFPTLGWGLGVFIHYLTVFGFPFMSNFERRWEQREIDRELRKKDSNRWLAKEVLEEEDYLELPEMEKKYDESDFV